MGLKRRKIEFRVRLVLCELSAVPFVNGILFSKLKVMQGNRFLLAGAGGSAAPFEATSSRQRVKHHTVVWEEPFEFPVSVETDSVSGVLSPCICRISLRKETLGGKSFERIGFVNLNLAEFAGMRDQERRYILDSDSHHERRRQDNSLLRVAVTLQLASGDPFFKVPQPALLPAAGLSDAVTPIASLVGLQGRGERAGGGHGGGGGNGGGGNGGGGGGNGNGSSSTPAAAASESATPFSNLDGDSAAAAARVLNEDIENQTRSRDLLCEPHDTRAMVARTRRDAERLVEAMLEAMPAEQLEQAREVPVRGAAEGGSLESYLQKDGTLAFNARDALFRSFTS